MDKIDKYLGEGITSGIHLMRFSNEIGNMYYELDRLVDTLAGDPYYKKHYNKMKKALKSFGKAIDDFVDDEYDRR